MPLSPGASNVRVRLRCLSAGKPKHVRLLSLSQACLELYKPATCPGTSGAQSWLHHSDLWSPENWLEAGSPEASSSVIRYWNQVKTESSRAHLILPYHELPWLFQPTRSVKGEVECNESLAENLVGWTEAEECSTLDGNLQLHLESAETHEAKHLPSEGSLQDKSAVSNNFCLNFYLWMLHFFVHFVAICCHICACISMCKACA